MSPGTTSQWSVLSHISADTGLVDVLGFEAEVSERAKVLKPSQSRS